MAMPAADRERTRRWTAREVRALIATQPLATPRYELVDGELLATPSPNRAHQIAVSRLWRDLDQYLTRNPVGGALISPFDVELEAESVTQPDVFVLPPAEWKRLRSEMPARELLVAAEILSPSSGRYDRITKRRLYQRHVSEYWIVDLDARMVERWLPADSRPEILLDELRWYPSGAQEELRLNLARYFAECLEG